MSAQDLIRARCAIKRKLTNFAKFMDEYVQNPQPIVLKTRYERFKPELDNFERIQSEIEKLCDENDFETQLNTRTEFEELSLKHIANAEKILRECPSEISNVSTVTVGNANNNNESQPIEQINFPRLELPKFDGAIESWPGFSDAFLSAVHADSRFSDVQKLIYLRSCLNGKAANKIESLPTTCANYKVAWDLLEKSYYDPNHLIFKHIKAFFDLPRSEKASANAICDILDKARKHYRALQALNEDFLEAFPIYAITSKLDEETRIKWKEIRVKDKAPTMEKLLEFLHERQRVLEDATYTKNSKANNNKSNNNHLNKNNNNYNYNNKSRKQVRNNFEQNNRASSTTFSARVTSYCQICKGNHFTQTCPDFVKLKIEERLELVQKLKLCANCLRSNHTTNNCFSGGCKNCAKKHHTLLHKDESSQNQQTNIACLSSNSSNHVLLSTALVNVVDNDGELHRARVLLDSGSQINFISNDLARILRLTERNSNTRVTGINNSSTIYSREINAVLKSRTSNFSVSLPFLVRDSFQELVPSFQVNLTALDLPSNLVLADPEFHKPGKIDAILGAKIFYKILCAKQKYFGSRDALLQKTRFGWLVTGDVPVEPNPSTLFCGIATENLNDELLKFWEIEEVQSVRALSAEEAICEQHYADNTSRDPKTGRYVVRLPFKTNKQELGSSYEIALKRFYSLERKLNKDLVLKNQYNEFLEEYLSLGHMTERDHASNLLYLPHHGVLKQSSLTTKLRVVFDASSKTSSGFSLNDVLCVGPVVQEDLLSIVIRFRSHAYVLSADVEKMYRQIMLHEDDRIYQNILWRDNTNDRIKVYQLNTITYGTAPASFLATRTLIQLAEDEATCLPQAARALKLDFYMDDLLTGAQSLSEAKILKSELLEVTGRGNLPLRQWASNASELIEESDDHFADRHINLNLDETIKTLGLHWNAKEDVLIYIISDNPHDAITKRTILSRIAKIFDPLGLLGPLIIRAKMLMQRLWQLKIDWDQTLPVSISSAWLDYERELKLIKNLKFRRKVILNDYVDIEMHGFGDASEGAYGACIYIKTTDVSRNSYVHLVCGKSKVSPLKTIVLPRLELCAALLVSRLMSVVKASLHHIHFKKITLWSDSTITLNWIKTQPKLLKIFVNNRVAAIQKHTASCKWRYVPSDDNPADLLTRGATVSELKNCKLWSEGPSWLVDAEESWPNDIIEIIDIPELKNVSSLTAKLNECELLKKYSSFRKLLRVFAFCIRFINNSRGASKFNKSTLDVEELNEATIKIIKLIQSEGFSEEIKLLKNKEAIKGSMACLCPFIDKSGVLRVGGRLSLARLKFTQKHQALLPKHHAVTNMIIRELHEKSYHAGAQATLNMLRDSYWIIDGRQYVKYIIHKCVSCSRAKPMIPEYLMGNLPSNRVNCSRAFLHSGVDFCGPFMIKEKRFRNRGKVKVYVAVFICFSTKTIHLEIVEDLSCEAFLAALRRFFARRGRSSDLYSDNATNFVSTKRQLNETQKFIHDNKTKVESGLSDLGIRWHFIPSRAPHFGGLWEAAVKSFKRHLMHVASNALLSYETLLTYVVEIEAILNSRPLVPRSSDPSDINALTPGHFLIGEALTGISDLNINMNNTLSTQLPSWQHIQLMRNHFWSRWSREYLHTLTTRKKWHAKQPAKVELGSIVILKENNLPPMKWPLARVIAVHPGKDNIIRTVTVKSSSGEYKRPLKGLAPLPIDIE